MSHTQRLAQPKDFGKYQLVARLAHGRMGDVYKAKSHGVEGFEKILVVKVIHPAFSAIPNFVDTIIEEAKRAVSLSHANVAQVFDLGLEENEQQFYLAMEYINGMDLTRAMATARDSHRAWPQEIAVFVASEVAKGLDYAHRRKDFNFNSLNIVHRALTPQNIILSYDGEVKLTDFGITRAMDLTEPIDNEDMIRRHLYQAPEVARGEECTRQSDIFSLGLVLYEMLAGRHPYFDIDPKKVFERACRADIPPISGQTNTPRQLAQILDSMLVHDPAGRAASAGALYEELIGYLFGNNLKADNRSMALTMQELRRRDKGATRESTLELGLEEISLHELQASYEKSEALYQDGDETGTGEISEATKSALPSARIAQMLKGQPALAAEEQPPLPGALEDYFRSVSAGRGKAVLVSGRLGRGRQYLPDRLIETLGWRENTKAFSIQTTADDCYRPFGVLSDLILRCLNQTVSETMDHRQGALQVLKTLRVPDDALATLAGLWDVETTPQVGYQLRRTHLCHAFMALVRDLSHEGPLVLVIDQVERVDVLSLDVLRHVVAEIGKLPVMLVLGTEMDESMRGVFDTGQPEDLEALRINAEEPPPPEDVAKLGADAQTIITILTLSEQALAQSDLAELTGIEDIRLMEQLRRLIETGAVRVPRPGIFIGGCPNWLTWFEQHAGSTEIEHLASSLGRYYIHRVIRGEIDRLTPTLVRLHAFGGDRRQMVALAQNYGNWLEHSGWHQSALEFYKHCANLLARPSLGTPQTRIDYVLSAAEIALELSLIDECRSIL
ncbi:MAG: serine/threonine protein kinase, partial [Bradymonadaceae bacterium]